MTFDTYLQIGVLVYVASMAFGILVLKDLDPDPVKQTFKFIGVSLLAMVTWPIPLVALIYGLVFWYFRPKEFREKFQ